MVLPTADHPTGSVDRAARRLPNYLSDSTPQYIILRPLAIRRRQARSHTDLGSADTRIVTDLIIQATIGWWNQIFVIITLLWCCVCEDLRYLHIKICGMTSTNVPLWHNYRRRYVLIFLVKRTLQLLLNATHIRVIIVHTPLIYRRRVIPSIAAGYTALSCRYIILGQTAFGTLDDSLGWGLDLTVEVRV